MTQTDKSNIAKYDLTGEQMVDYLERVSICVESGASEDLACRIALKQIGVEA